VGDGKGQRIGNEGQVTDSKTLALDSLADRKGQISIPNTQHLTGRVIKAGVAEGIALVSSQPIGFLGGVDPETGEVIEPGHPLAGQCVAGRVLVFPTGKGSTVGSYTLYRMAKAGMAPAAILNAESEAIVAVGAIIADIPMVDKVDITRIRTGNWVQVAGNQVVVGQRVTSDG
jgi:predicted aconitase with swiveling domain